MILNIASKLILSHDQISIKNQLKLANHIKIDDINKRLGLTIKIMKGQSLATKSSVGLGYKLTQYLFIGGEF